MKKQFLLTFIVISAAFNTSPCKSQTYPSVSTELLKKYDPEYDKFKGAEIADKIIFYQIRKIGEAIVQGDKIVYQFDKKTKELIDVKIKWRKELPDVLPTIISQQQARTMVSGKIRFTQLYYIAEDSAVFPIDPTPKNPCWLIESTADGDITATIIDAVEGKIVGYAVPPPHDAFSMSGPMYSTCAGTWQDWYINAKDWFNAMGYDTEFRPGVGTSWAFYDKIQSHIQSNETALFFEIAHGGSFGFQNACDVNENYFIYPDHISTWIADYPKMPFTILFSCGGSCYTDEGSLSHAFRKGSNKDTAALGYCGMSGPTCSPECWYGSDTLLWQDTFFDYLSQGWTVKAAFDQTNIDYPGCGIHNCLRFAGDENFRIVPVVRRSLYRFVDANAPDGGDGLSWASAYNDLQDALEDPAREVWVAAGTYKPDRGTADRLASFQVPDNVAIYGGFPPGGGTWQQRDPELYETILSGDLNGDDGPGFSNNGDNSVHIVFCYDKKDVILDGLTISGGNADESGYGDGGGILCRAASSIKLINCAIIGNRASTRGGAICCENSIAKFTNCRISGNSATIGGGIGLNDRKMIDNLTFRNCTITANKAADQGGGIGGLKTHGNIEISDSIIRGNLPEQIIDPRGTFFITYSNIQDGWTGPGNIDTDPCFARPDRWVDVNNLNVPVEPNDPNAVWIMGDYHLKSRAGRWDPNSQSWIQDALDSPCIDAGKPSTDLAAEDDCRHNFRINMGAYGGTAKASRTEPGWCLAGDLNNDRLTNFLDYAILAEKWLLTGTDIAADLDKNKIVDSGDLYLFTGSWMTESHYETEPNLVAHYKLDEPNGTTAYDYTCQNNGSFIAEPDHTKGFVGTGAIKLDGQSQYININDSNELEGFDELSISLWIKKGQDNEPNEDTIISKCDANNTYLLRYDSADDQLEWIIGKADVCDSSINSVSIEDDKWHHIAAIYDGSAGYVYLDGSILFDTALLAGGIGSNNCPLWIGANPNPAEPNDYFAGCIDEVKIYNRALGESQIRRLYQQGYGPKAREPYPQDDAVYIIPDANLSWAAGFDANSHDVYLGTSFDDVNDANTSSPDFIGNFDINTFDANLSAANTYYWRVDEKSPYRSTKGDIWTFKTMVEPNFVAWWKFDEGFGAITLDSAGNNNGDVIRATWTAGQIGNALKFDGSDGHVEIPHSELLSINDELTISLWVKMDELYENYEPQTILSKMTPDSSNITACFNYHLFAIYGGDLLFEFTGSDESDNIFSTANSVLTVGNWCHLCVVHRFGFSSSTKIYLNGVEKNGGWIYGTGNEIPLTGTLPLEIGARLNGEINYILWVSDTCKGTIDSVRIYNRALSQTEVQAIYQAEQ